jgi:hypothetical protein
VDEKKWAKTVYDPDVKNEKEVTPDQLKAWAAKAKGSCYFFIIGKDGSVIKEGPVTSEAALLTAIGGK